MTGTRIAEMRSKKRPRPNSSLRPRPRNLDETCPIDRSQQQGRCWSCSEMEIGASFKQKTGHAAVLSIGASEQFYSQITQEVKLIEATYFRETMTGAARR